VQLAAFLGGGLLCPAAHMAWHRPDHTHGPGGATIAFDVGKAPRERARGTDHTPRLRSPVARHAHPQPHTHAHATATRSERASRRGAPGVVHHTHPHPAEPASPGSGPETRPGPAARDVPPTSPGHGHGSLAHFGLALLSAPPALTLPPPEPAGDLIPSVHPRGAALHQPSFPLPRPPPSPVSA
jgi:hypothetical protein